MPVFTAARAGILLMAGGPRAAASCVGRSSIQNALAVPERPGRPRTREPPQAAPARRRADAAPQAAPGRPSTPWTSQHGPGASQNALGVPERARPSQNAEAAPERHPPSRCGGCPRNAPARFMVGTRTERGPTCPAVGPVPERAPPYRYAPVATLKVSFGWSPRGTAARAAPTPQPRAGIPIKLSSQNCIYIII